MTVPPGNLDETASGASLAAHTAGPWSFSTQEGRRGNCLVAQVWRQNGGSLAEIEPTYDPAEANANARLIAAAPDLLEAAQTLQMLMRLAAMKFGFDLTGSAGMELADAAIAKALGPTAHGTTERLPEPGSTP